MRIKKEREPVEMTCIDCGETFIAYSKNAKRCAICRKIRQRQQSKKCMEYLRGHRSIGKTYKIVPKMTIREVLIELERYNKANGTRLSYGQFVTILDKAVQ